MKPRSKLSDLHLRALFLASQHGDAAAYEDLLKHIRHITLAYLHPRISNTDEMEDVVQEVLISVHRALATYDGMRNFMPWLFSIIIHRFKDFLRKEYRNPKLAEIDEGTLEQQGGLSVTESIISNELLGKAMSVLNAKQKRVIELMHIQGFTAKEVGEKMDMSVSAVKVTSHRAIKHMQKEFRNDDAT